MSQHDTHKAVKEFSLISSVFGALIFVTILIFAAHETAIHIYAAPIEPPQGYPKFNQSIKTVTPTLANTGGATLYYVIEIRNTGAYTAEGVTMNDALPSVTTYNGDAWASSPPAPNFTDGILSWSGEVGFDASVIVSFSVIVTNTFSGVVQNTAVISHPVLSKPVTITSETVVTDEPIFQVAKTSTYNAYTFG